MACIIQSDSATNSLLSSRTNWSTRTGHTSPGLFTQRDLETRSPADGLPQENNGKSELWFGQQSLGLMPRLKSSTLVP